jgi:hypothetical protein
MKALILYQEFAAASAANAALQNSADRPDISVRWNIRPWRIDVLKYPPTARESLMDAMDAHLIVIAGHCSHRVPFSLLRWLESWAEGRQIENATLAMVGCCDTVSLSAGIAPELCEFAQRHGLGLITEDDTKFDRELSALRFSQKQADFVPTPGARFHT